MSVKSIKHLIQESRPELVVNVVFGCASVIDVLDHSLHKRFTDSRDQPHVATMRKWNGQSPWRSRIRSARREQHIDSHNHNTVEGGEALFIMDAIENWSLQSNTCSRQSCGNLKLNNVNIVRFLTVFLSANRMHRAGQIPISAG